MSYGNIASTKEGGTQELETHNFKEEQRKARSYPYSILVTFPRKPYTLRESWLTGGKGSLTWTASASWCLRFNGEAIRTIISIGVAHTVQPDSGACPEKVMLQGVCTLAERRKIIVRGKTGFFPEANFYAAHSVMSSYPFLCMTLSPDILLRGCSEQWMTKKMTRVIRDRSG